MRNFILITLLILFSIFSINLHAQTFGLMGGINSSMLYQNSSEGRTVDNEGKIGFTFGPTMELEINKSISFNMGMLISLKGTRNDYMDTDVDLYQDVLCVENTNLCYLDIPLLFNFSHNMGFFEVYGEVGPSFGFGIGGNEVFKRTEDGKTLRKTQTIHFGRDVGIDSYKGLDAGMIFGAGVQYENIQFGFQTNFGLTNIAVELDDSYVLKNRIFQFVAVYKFKPYNYHRW